VRSHTELSTPSHDTDDAAAGHRARDSAGNAVRRKMVDITMLVMTGGRERTAERQQVLSSAGLTLPDRTQTSARPWVEQ